MTQPQNQAAGTYGLTVRCRYRKLFLTPFILLMHQGILYALARALRATGAVLQQITIEPNHIHLTVTVLAANLPTLKRLFFGEAAKFVDACLREHGFEGPGKVFDRAHQMRLVNAAAQLVYLHYSDIQVVKDGLTGTVEEYPGFVSDPWMLKGTKLDITRPPIHFDPKRNPADEQVPFDNTPRLKGELGTDRTVEHLERARRGAERAYAAERKWPVLGSARLVKQHPWGEPASPRKWEPGPIPSFRVVDDPELDRHCRMEVRGFRGQYAEAREARLRGEHVVWPAGTYLMKVQHGVEVAAPDRESVLAADDVYEELPARLGAEDCRAISERLRELCARVDPEQQEDALGARIDAGAENAVTRRESPRVQTAGEETPARLVTLRGNLRVREFDTVGEPPEVEAGDDTSVAPRDERDDGEPPDEPGDR